MKKDGWHFGKEHGFTGSAGAKQVSGYQRGGKVQRHTDKMARKPDVDAMAKGGKVKSAPKKPSPMQQAALQQVLASAAKPAPAAPPSMLPPGMRKGGKVKGC